MQNLTQVTPITQNYDSIHEIISNRNNFWELDNKYAKKQLK